VPIVLVMLVEPAALVAVVPIELDSGVADDVPLGAPVAVVPIGSVTNPPVTPVTLPATVVRAAGDAPVVPVAVVPKEPGTLVVVVVVVVVAVVLVVVVPVDPVTPVEPVVLVGIPNAVVSL